MHSESFLVQILLVLSFGHMLGRLASLCGQPPAVGQILAGVVIGSMVIGGFNFFLNEELFSSTDGIIALSKVGLSFIMFEIGLHAGGGRVGQSGLQVRSAVFIALAGTLGGGLAGGFLGLFAYQSSGSSVNLLPFVLFMAVALAATAIPVLASIMEDRRFPHKAVAPLTLNAAAVSDVLVWLGMSVVLIAISGDGLVDIVSATIAIVVLVIGAEIISRFYRRDASQKVRRASPDSMIIPLVILFGFCSVASLANAHATIGAFIAGLAFRGNAEVRGCWETGPKVLVAMFFAPLFFGTAALNVSTGPMEWNAVILWAVIFFLVGGLAKIGASSLCARLMGLSASDSVVIGVLMNTKGVMEIVLLTIGLDMKILSTELYSALLVSALLSTMLTLPLVRLLPIRNPQFAMLTGKVDSGSSLTLRSARPK